MSPLHVYIIIVNYKRWQDTKECLQALLRSTYTDYSVLVIDNASGNQSLENLSEWLTEADPSTTHRIFQPVDLAIQINDITLPKVTFIQQAYNKGFAGANNFVLNLTRKLNAYVWLLNPDMIPDELALEKLVDFAASHPRMSITGSVVRKWEGNHELFFYGGGKVNFYTATITFCKRLEPRPGLDFISGGCLFTHLENVDKLGLLPEQYFLYWEDTDWCYAARQQGYQLLVCTDAVCFDKVSTVIGKGFLADYYYSRNGLYFLARFGKRYLWLALLSMIIRYFKKLFSGQWERARGIWRGTVDYLKRKQHEVE